MTDMNTVKQINTNVISISKNEAWWDSKLMVVDRTTLTKYVSGKFNIDVVVDDFWLEDNKKKIVKNKVIVNIFNGNKKLKRKLFWIGATKWDNMSIKDLVMYTLKTIK
jgi:hypothetical protein